MTTPVELSRHFDREAEKSEAGFAADGDAGPDCGGQKAWYRSRTVTLSGQEVIIDDITLNRMELAIEEQAFKLLALRQPVATDLRLTVAAMRIATELERIGDQAVNIAERAWN